MSKVITKTSLQDAIVDASAAALAEAAREKAVAPGRTLVEARRLAAEIAGDPRIAPALEPISRFESQTLRGVVIAAGAPLVVALGRAIGAPIADGAAAEVMATLLSLAGAAYAWYGRETTTRPLK